MMQGMLFDMPPAPQHATELPSPEALARCVRVEQTLREAFGEIRQGYDHPYATGGDWSTHDLLAYLLEQTGPCHLVAATWSVAEHAAHRLIHLLEAGQLLSLTMLVDWRVQVRTPGFMPLAKLRFTRVGVSTCHAKVFALLNDAWGVAGVGSANFTNNPRIEAGHLSTARQVAEFHAGWIRQEVERAAPFGCDMRARGKADGRA